MTVSKLEPKCLREEAYTDLLTARGFHPCGHYRELSSDQLRAFVLKRLSPDTRLWGSKGKDFSAIIGVRDMTWDTEQLGFPSARIELFSYTLGEGTDSVRCNQVNRYIHDLVNAVIKDCKKRNIQYLVARIPAQVPIAI